MIRDLFSALWDRLCDDDLHRLCRTLLMLAMCYTVWCGFKRVDVVVALIQRQTVLERDIADMKLEQEHFKANFYTGMSMVRDGFDIKDMKYDAPLLRKSGARQ